MHALTRRAFEILLVSAVLGGHTAHVLADPPGKRNSSSHPTVGESAPDFELEAVDGKKVKLSTLTGKGPVVLVVLRGYPGYQCPVCTQQVSQLLGQAKKFKDAKATVLMIYPGPATNLKAHGAEFVRGKTLPDNFYLLLDPDYTFTNAYQLRWKAPAETAYPSTFVIDTKRTVKFVKVSKSHGGRAATDEVLQAIDRQ